MKLAYLERYIIELDGVVRALYAEVVTLKEQVKPKPEEEDAPEGHEPPSHY